MMHIFHTQIRKNSTFRDKKKSNSINEQHPTLCIYPKNMGLIKKKGK